MNAVTTRLAVVGAGSMGAQIAQQAALHGIDVALQDKDEAQLRKARDSNQGHLARQVEKGRLSSSDAQAALERVRLSTDLQEAVADAELAIEAEKPVCVNVDGEVSDSRRLEYRARPKDLYVHVVHRPGEAMLEIPSRLKRRAARSKVRSGLP